MACGLECLVLQTLLDVPDGNLQVLCCKEEELALLFGHLAVEENDVHQLIEQVVTFRTEVIPNPSRALHVKFLGLLATPKPDQVSLGIIGEGQDQLHKPRAFTVGQDLGPIRVSREQTTGEEQVT